MVHESHFDFAEVRCNFVESENEVAEMDISIAVVMLLSVVSLEVYPLPALTLLPVESWSLQISNF